MLTLLLVTERPVSMLVCLSNVNYVDVVVGYLTSRQHAGVSE